MIETRIALPDDQPNVRLIQELAFATVRHIYAPKKSAKPAGDRSGAIGIVALANHSLIGSVDTLAAANELRISCLAVHPDFKRRGVARSLIDHAQKLAKQSNCLTMTLCTVMETGNVGIFNRLGFTVITETVADWCTSQKFSVLHEVQMEKHCK